MLSQKQMFVKKILCQFVETEGSDQTGKTESLPAHGLSNHFNGWDVGEAPGFVSIGSSRNASRRRSRLQILTVDPDCGGTAYTQLLCLFLR